MEWGFDKACVELFEYITLTLSCLADARELLAEGKGESPQDLEKVLAEARSFLSLAKSRAELLPGLIYATEQKEKERLWEEAEHMLLHLLWVAGLLPNLSPGQA